MLKEKNGELYYNGEQIRLCGVNVAGLEWSSSGEQIFESIRVACDEWGANIIRLPVAQDRWFGYMPEQNGNFEPYREIVDKIVKMLAERGKFMILDLHWSDLGIWGKNVGQHRLPDENSIKFWLDAAPRYKDCDNVLFGIYNEPHLEGLEAEEAWKVWRNGGTLEEKGITYRAVGMQEMVDAVRSTGAKNMVVVGGLDWGYDLKCFYNGYDIDDDNLMMDSHVYPWKLTHDFSKTEDKIHPILIGEFGHYGNDANPVEGKQSLPHEEWMPLLYEWMNRNNISFTAWDFHPKAGPCIIKNWNYEPTDFHGVYVKEQLRK